jgi:hypothetical protein
MSEGASPIGPNERVLRRIFVGQGCFEKDKAPPVQRGAFIPSPRDVDGLSFYLESIISAPEVAAAAEKPAACYVVASLKAGDLYALGLTLVPTQDPHDLPGHIISPEINSTTYNDSTQKPKIKEISKKLAEIASHNIVFGRVT